MLGCAALLLAGRPWPREHPEVLAQRHEGLAHSHAFVIDEEHPKWPR